MTIRRKVITIAVTILIISFLILVFTLIELNSAERSIQTFDKELSKYNLTTKVSETVEEMAFKSIKTLKIAVLLSFVAFIFLLIFTVIIPKKLLKKIKSILYGIKMFENGNFSYRIQKFSEDESGLIVDSLNSMAKKIEKTKSDLEDSLESEKKLRKMLEKQLNHSLLLKEIIYASMRKWDLKSLSRIVLSSLEKHGWINYGAISIYKENKIKVITFSPKSQDIAKKLNYFEDTEIDIKDISVLKGWLESRKKKSIEIDLSTISDKILPIKKELFKKGIKNILATPLLAHDKLLGFVFTGKKDSKKFSYEEQNFLQDLSVYISFSIQNLETYNELTNSVEDLREAKQKIAHQERLIALGNMASGIAHDINNSLSPIVGFSDLLLSQNSKLNKTAKRYISYIKNAADDIAKTLNRLRDFYRKENGDKVLTNVDINKLINHVIHMNKSKWKDQAESKGIKYEIIKNLYEKLPAVLINKNSMRDAINNIFINALEAMPNGGKIIIETGKENERFYIKFSDTGKGMSKKMIDRSVEPFYSTKGESGTGLGLSQVYGFVKRYKGKLDIQSVPDKGTTIMISFPIVKKKNSIGGKTVIPVSEPGNLYILTIDDDAMLRILLKEMLQSLGHKVIIGENGKHGIELFKEFLTKNHPVDLVITDLGMPEVNGKRVTIEIKKLKPNTPVILLTGWGERFTSENKIPREVDVVLNKPPRLQELKDEISKIFAKKG